jgi:hypothetical protein
MPKSSKIVEGPGDKMYILLRGKAKDFTAKSLDELEIETKNLRQYLEKHKQEESEQQHESVPTPSAFAQRRGGVNRGLTFTENQAQMANQDTTPTAHELPSTERTNPSKQMISLTERIHPEIQSDKELHIIDPIVEKFQESPKRRSPKPIIPALNLADFTNHKQKHNIAYPNLDYVKETKNPRLALLANTTNAVNALRRKSRRAHLLKSNKKEPLQTKFITREGSDSTLDGQKSSDEDLTPMTNTDDTPTSTASKRLRKFKALMPFVKGINEVHQKTVTEMVENKKYKTALKKKRTSFKTGLQFAHLMNEKEVDEFIAEIFLKKKSSYFLGGVLKVRFSGFFYPGDCFSIRALKELSLSSRATIAMTECVCLTIDREDYLNVFEKEKARVKKKFDVFTKVFSKYGEEFAINFSHYWESEKHLVNHVIYRENEKPEYLYLIGDGDVMVIHSVQI